MEAVALTDCYWWEKPAANENVRRGNHLVESDTLGNTTTEYVWLGNQRLATINNTGTYYSHNDHLGTPQLMTDSAGVIAWQADYDPFGKATVTTSTITNNLRFPGQYYDSETGNHYNYFRDYDSATGRYLTADPLGLAGGINTYVYTLNNPILLIDPLGLTSSCSFYTKRCNEAGGKYYCTFAPTVCENWPDDPWDWDGCVRKCLQDKDCKADPCGGADVPCIAEIHAVCWWDCATK